MERPQALTIDPPFDKSIYLNHANYRAHVDGLRGIAVLSVVGFHAAPGRVPGGFIGVDIFFVISGFLISSIIFDGLATNTFNFVKFYTRRIKRIFPALIVILLGCFIFAQFVLVADEYKQLSKHVAGGAGFVSNLILWSESGYFDNASETKPLLHLWSLGVEEQFYIIWPITLWFAWNKRVNILVVIVLIAVLSFLINIYYIYVDAAFAFYTPLSRFWELLIGAALAFARYQTRASFHDTGNMFNNILACAGCLVIATSLWLIDKDQRFPGWLAILPTTGAALIIAAGSKAWVNRVILSNPKLVWFGLISFPLYLWHWPLLSFLRVLHSSEVPQQARFVAVLASIVLAWLTYIFIEKPIRFGAPNRYITAALVSLVAITGWLGWNGYARDEFRLRFVALPKVANEGDIGNDRYFEYLQRNFYSCTPIELLMESDVWHGIRRCFQSEEKAEKQVALIGDSHAEHLFAGLAEALTGVNLVMFGQGGIPFTNDKDFKNIFNYVLNDKNITRVILSAHWNAKFISEHMSAVEVEAGLLETVNKLSAAGKRVFITDDVPEFSFDPYKCKYDGRLGLAHNCSEDASLLRKQLQMFQPILQSVADRNVAVKIIPTAEMFCDKNECSMARDGVLFFRDAHHLNINGSKYLGKLIIQNDPGLIE
jgi:peptidoglycan/LPS O-acetylase OafA/YrhL